MTDSVSDNTDAIAELNSHSGLINNVIPIDNADLNNYNTTGVYYVRAGATHIPQSYCVVFVFAPIGTSDRIQIAFDVVNAKMYRRRYSSTNGWGAWTMVTFS